METYIQAVQKLVIKEVVLHADKKIEMTKKVSSNQSLANYTDDTPLVFGDYNGDGLTDFMMPQQVYDIASSDIANLFYRMQTDKNYWNVYQGNGSKTMPFNLR